MDVYANALTAEALKREFAYVFADKKYPGIPQINLYTIDESFFTIGDIPIQPFTVWHHKMPVYGFRFKNFTYITDANKIDEPVKEVIKGSEVIVLNALRNEHHVAHFSLKEAVSLVNELEVPEAYFTHISHQLGQHETVENNLPSNIHLAYDGLELDI
jgi:phosphoribosyl 1,2-cyclic phosphate phosphodiesterase